MARLPRLAVPGEVHFVVLRGNNGEAVFVDDADRRTWLDTLREVMAANGVAVHAYAMLTSEAQLLVTPEEQGALSRAMQALGRRYVARFNRRHGRSGTLWQGRFRATIIESPRYFLDCVVQVESSPVKSGLVAAPDAWAWSSVAHHLGLRRDPLVADHPAFWGLGNTPFERDAAYRRRLDQGLPSALAAAIDDAAVKGWALGTPAFLGTLAQRTERPLAQRPRGRPRKRPIMPT